MGSVKYRQLSKSHSALKSAGTLLSTIIIMIKIELLVANPEIKEIGLEQSHDLLKNQNLSHRLMVTQGLS